MKKTVAALRALTPNPGGIAPRPARKKQIISNWYSEASGYSVGGEAVKSSGNKTAQSVHGPEF